MAEKKPKKTRIKIPKLGVHSATGQARVILNGVDHYLGRAGSPEAREAYDRLIAEWLAGGRKQVTKGLSVAELADQFGTLALKTYLLPSGAPTSHGRQLNRIMKEWAEVHGNKLLEHYRPADLRWMRDQWHQRGLSHKSVIHYTNNIQLAFKYAEERDLVSPQVAGRYSGGRGSSTWTRLRQADAEGQAYLGSDLVAAINHLRRPADRDLFRLLWLTGARIGEWAIFQHSLLDRSRTVWRYSPDHHKSSWRGRDRIVFVGPRAQEILEPYLSKPAQFQPFYGTGTSTAMRFSRACTKAGVEHHHPHQIRHATATRIAREYGIEAAALVLGHKLPGNAITLSYVERDYSLAERVMLEIG